MVNKYDESTSRRQERYVYVNGVTETVVQHGSPVHPPGGHVTHHETHEECSPIFPLLEPGHKIGIRLTGVL